MLSGGAKPAELVEMERIATEMMGKQLTATESERLLKHFCMIKDITQPADLTPGDMTPPPSANNHAGLQPSQYSAFELVV